MYYRGCWHIVGRSLFKRYRQHQVITYLMYSSLIKELYDPRIFIVHAPLLGQAFAHCRKFPTAASRRSLGRVSVPMWLFNLSVQLRIIDLVGRYLTNYLMRRKAILACSRSCFKYQIMRSDILSSISSRFQPLSSSLGQVPYVLLTHLPLEPKLSYDMHVLGMVPAFILSQDRTLHKIYRKCIISKVL